MLQVQSIFRTCTFTLALLTIGCDALAQVLVAQENKAADVDRNSPELQQLRAARRTAAQKQRRLIFNNDGAEPVIYCRDTSREEFLKYRTKGLENTHVDSIFYCSRSSGFSVFTHNTKIGEIFASKEGRYANNMTKELLAAGTDPIAVTVDFCHQHRMEGFWSMRMNDTHDGSGADYGPIMFRANRLKNAHPEWLISNIKKKPKFGAWSAVDYAHAEIRDLAFQYIEEVCNNYDVDGIELDFFRHPVFFKRAAMSGTVCNDEERKQMTDFVHRIRSMTEVVGLKRGRPILVAMRVPDSVEYARDIGLDIEQWLAKDLMDLMIVGSYFRLNPWKMSADLGHKYNVRVYASLDESRVRDEASRKLRDTEQAYRGRALEAWQAGMDGIYLFNAFDPKHSMWKELGDAQLLANSPRDHFASVLGLGAAAGGALPHKNYMSLTQLNPAHPMAIQPGTSSSIAIHTGNQPSLNTKVVLRLHFKQVPSASAITIQWNGVSLKSEKTSEDGWITCSVAPADCKAGENEVKISVSPDASPVVWQDAHVQIRN